MAYTLRECLRFRGRRLQNANVCAYPTGVTQTLLPSLCTYSWDTRNDSNTKPVYNVHAHEAEINCVAFCPGSEWVVATGSGDKVRVEKTAFMTRKLICSTDGCALGYA